MRNSISIVLVLVAITCAFASTLLGGLAEANAANGFVVSNGTSGLLVALVLGLIGAGIKPRSGRLTEELMQARWAIAYASTVEPVGMAVEQAVVEAITVELPAVAVEQPIIEAMDVATLTALCDTLEAILVASAPMPRTLGELEQSLAARGITSFLPPKGESLLSRRAHTVAFLPSCFA